MENEALETSEVVDSSVETSNEATAVEVTSAESNETSNILDQEYEAPSENPFAGLSEEYIKDGKIFGKYNNIDDLAKSHQHLQSKLGAGAHVVPDTYDFAPVLEETGMEIRDDEVTQERYNSFINDIKEAGITQEQASLMMRHYAANAQALESSLRAEHEDELKSLGFNIDPEPHIQKLQERWGGNYESKTAELTQWAKTNLPEEALNYPLKSTADGLLLLERVMKMHKGAMPITNTKAASISVEQAQQELSTIFSDPKYRLNTEEGKRLNERADQLAAIITKNKR